MNFDDIKLEYEEDIKWEFNKIGKYLQNLPSIIAKYQNYWFKYKRMYDKLETEYDELWISRFVYYKHDFDIKLTNSEIKDFLNKDKELNTIKSKIKQILAHNDWLERALKNLDSTRWDIKNVIEFEKFKNGSF